MRFNSATNFVETEIGSIPREWSIISLGKVADVQTGFPFPSNQYGQSGIKVVRGENIKEGALDWSRLKTWDKVSGLEKYLLSEDDVVIAMDGNVGRNKALVRGEFLPMILAQRVARLRAKPQVLDQRFLQQIILSDSFKHYCDGVKTGTTIAHINQKQIESLLIPLPSLGEQKKIAEMLSSIDDKIELNNCINANLERLAAALFKKWFIEIGEELPEGWRVSKFTDIVDVLSGGTPKTNESEYWNGDIPFFTPRDADDSAYTFGTKKHITQSGLESCNSPLYPTNTTFITARGTVGKVAMAGMPMSMNQSCYALKGKGIVGPYFVYEITRRTAEELKQKAHGSVFSTITIPTFAQVSFPLPDSNLINKYEATVSPLFEEIRANCQENAKLISIKDSLLPRMMSGKVRVPSQNAQPVIKKSKAPEPFKEAALVADLIANFANPHPLTRYRYTKYSYFAKRYLGQDASKEYAQMPGGPYNPRMRYNGPESILVKKQYAKQTGNGFVAGPKMNEMLRYAQRYGFTSGVNFVRQELVGKTDNELELLSTTDYAMLNLGKKGNQASGPDDVITEIKSEAVWAPKLAKQHFSRDKIAQAIQWLNARQLKYGY